MITAAELIAMAKTAFASLKDAIDRGKPSEARSWLRLMQDLEKRAEKDAGSVAPSAGAPRPGEAAAVTREHDRLKALVRSGRARPADHLAFKAARQALLAPSPA